MTAVERMSLEPDLIKLLISEDKRLWMHHRQPLTPVVGIVVDKEIVFSSKHPELQELEQHRLRPCLNSRGQWRVHLVDLPDRIVGNGGSRVKVGRLLLRDPPLWNSCVAVTAVLDQHTFLIIFGGVKPTYPVRGFV